MLRVAINLSQFSTSAPYSSFKLLSLIHPVSNAPRAPPTGIHHEVVYNRAGRIISSLQGKEE